MIGCIGGALFGLAVLIILIASEAYAQSISIAEYTGPTTSSGTNGIADGPDGAVWFTEFYANKIGRITTAGTITEYPVPTPSGNPSGIVLGPDGALWFSEFYGLKIGRITTAGVITEYPAPRAYPDLGYPHLFRIADANRCRFGWHARTGSFRNTVVTWEFPILAKYRFPFHTFKPLIELGPSFRSPGNLNGTAPSVYGGTVGIGIEAPVGKLRLAPVLRYTHWAADGEFFQPRTKRNQIELLVGIAF